MKKTCFTLKICLLLCVYSFAQGNKNQENIKLYISQKLVSDNNPRLGVVSQTRLYNKITGLLNRTGVVEVGYNNFLVIPVLDILEQSESNTGMGTIKMTTCELTIYIMRQSYDDNETDEEAHAAVFNSYSKKIFGTAPEGGDVVNNAINSIKNDDEDIIAFLVNARSKIAEYFTKNCNEIIAEAVHAKKLNQYAKAISLYFSVPRSAPCYQEAMDLSVEVYKKYTYEQCNKNLLLIKAYVARAIKANDSSGLYYYKALGIIKELDPSTPATEQCFLVIKQEIAKIEQRFDEEQKRDWELKQKVVTDALEIEKIKAKTASRISESFVPHVILSSYFNHLNTGNR